jgi:hypothetical protein
MRSENLKFVKKFIKAFNDNFRPPFTEKGHASAEIEDDCLVIHIGRRDATFSIETGECVGAGTSLFDKE